MCSILLNPSLQTKISVHSFVDLIIQRNTRIRLSIAETRTNSISAAKVVFDPKSYKYDKNQPNTVLASKYKIGLYPAGSFANKNYAINAVRWERRLELAFEGYRFLDLQRWNKDPLFPQDMSALLNSYATEEKTRPSLFSVNKDAVFHKGINEIYPVPQSQIDIANSGGAKMLTQNPGY